MIATGNDRCIAGLKSENEKLKELLRTIRDNYIGLIHDGTSEIRVIRKICEAVGDPYYPTNPYYHATRTVQDDSGPAPEAGAIPPELVGISTVPLYLVGGILVGMFRGAELQASEIREVYAGECYAGEGENRYLPPVIQFQSTGRVFVREDHGLYWTYLKPITQGDSSPKPDACDQS